LDFTNALNPTLRLGLMNHTSTVKQTFFNKRAQSRLKPKRDTKNLRDYRIRESSNVKLFGPQRRRETAKLLQYLELIKATFDCSRNTTQQSAGLRRHEGNSVDPRNNNFLKLMMQSSRFFKIDARLDCL
jgi:hypothetical protein